MFMVLTVLGLPRTLRAMDDIRQTLDAMDSTRLLLALLFVAGYASAIGHLASERGRLWCTALAALSGLAFVGLTDPWVHGALLVVFGVVGVGGFIVLAWALSAWAARAQDAGLTLAAAVAGVEEVESLPTPAAMLMLPRRVRRLRRRLSTL